MKFKIGLLVISALILSNCKSTSDTSAGGESESGLNSFNHAKHIKKDSLSFTWYEADSSNESDVQNDFSYFDPAREHLLIVIPGPSVASKNQNSLVSFKKHPYLAFEGITAENKSDDIGALLQCRPSYLEKGESKGIKLDDLLKGNKSLDCDRNKAFNVGVLNWNFGDSFDIEEIQDKLWEKSTSNYLAGESLSGIYKEIVSLKDKYKSITIVGHSFGAAIAVRMYEAIALEAKDDKLSLEKLATRLVMTNPFFSKFGEGDFDHPDFSPAEEASKSLRNASSILADLLDNEDLLVEVKKVDQPTVEVYHSMAAEQERIGASYKDLKLGSTQSIYIELVPENLKDTQTVTWLEKEESREKEFSAEERSENYSLFWFLDTMARNVKPNVVNAVKGFEGGPSGATRTKSIMKLQSLSPNAWFEQVGGRRTMNTYDDSLKFKLN